MKLTNEYGYMCVIIDGRCGHHYDKVFVGTGSKEKVLARYEELVKEISGYYPNDTMEIVRGGRTTIFYRTDETGEKIFHKEITYTAVGVEL